VFEIKIPINFFSITPKDFNSYGSRRGNDDIMARGTFANIRLVNKLVKNTGPKTLHIPSGQEVIHIFKSIFFVKLIIIFVILVGRL